MGGTGGVGGMGGAGGRAAGHRSVPHTADARIEAWAPTREGCVAEAIAAMVDGFAETSRAHPTGTEEFRIDAEPGRAGPDEDLLADVLDRVVYLIDTTGMVPVASEVSAAGAGLSVRLGMAELDDVVVTGAAPKAVALHELRFGPDAAGWSCAVTLDV